MPWIAAGVVYDDNVFFLPRNLKQDDVFLRVTPGLQASYQSTPLTVIANYRFDAEEYSKHDSLSSYFQHNLHKWNLGPPLQQLDPEQYFWICSNSYALSWMSSR